jgi:hypothetical protein
VPQLSAVARMMLARQTCFCGALRSEMIASSRWRSARVTFTTIPALMMRACTASDNLGIARMNQTTSSTSTGTFPYSVPRLDTVVVHLTTALIRIITERLHTMNVRVLDQDVSERLNAIDAAWLPAARAARTMVEQLIWLFSLASGRIPPVDCS